MTDDRGRAACTTLGCDEPGAVMGTFHDGDGQDYRVAYCHRHADLCGEFFEADPTPARPGTADELREEIAEALVRREVGAEFLSEQSPEWQAYYRADADAVLALPRVQRLLAVEQRHPTEPPATAEQLRDLIRENQRLRAVEQRDEPITWPELVRRTAEDEADDAWTWAHCIVCGSTDVTTRGLILEDGPCGTLRRVAWCERVGCDVDRAQTDYLPTPRRALGGGDDA